jgi:hypothetical protein
MSYVFVVKAVDNDSNMRFIDNDEAWQFIEAGLGKVLGQRAANIVLVEFAGMASDEEFIAWVWNTMNVRIIHRGRMIPRDDGEILFLSYYDRVL